MHGIANLPRIVPRGENPPKARAVSGVMTIARSPPSSQLGQAALS
jgi:hypothetical protein